MRALHIFPFFDDRLDDGARRYTFMLSKELAGAGVEVDVLTTTSDAARHTSAVSHRWANDQPPGTSTIEGIRVHRFPVTASMPALGGRAISALLRQRWRMEARSAGARNGAVNIESLHRAALERSAVYDWLMLLARGPHSSRLLRFAHQRAADADVVTAGFLPFATAWYAAQIADRSGKPLVVLPLLHANDRSHHFRLFYRLLRRAEAVLVQTPHALELVKRLAPGAQPVCVGAGVEPGEWSERDIDGRRFRARHRLDDERIILFVGRKERGKRYDVLVRAVESLDDARIRLVMIGADVDGVELRSRSVLFLGACGRAELLDAYAACDVFASASEHESFGIVFLEAWMSGKPVLGNRDCGAVAALIADGEDGYLCANAAEFAARIRQLVENPQLAGALGRAGREKTLSRHSWQKAAARVREVYERLAHERRAL